MRGGGGRQAGERTLSVRTAGRRRWWTGSSGGASGSEVGTSVHRGWCADEKAKLAVAGVYPLRYNPTVLEIRQTDEFASWFQRLRDPRARGRILARIRRLQLGNPGDVAPVGEGVSELRIHFGPGYRVYFLQQGAVLVVLLAGGDKKTQSRDIARARELARRL